MTDVFLARQPIFNRQLRVFAYELLFRSGPESVSATDMRSADDASLNVLEQAFENIGLETVVGDKRAFINVTRHFILTHTDPLLPTQQVVIELLEDQLYDEALLEGLKRLKAQGFMIALDDFMYHEALQELVALADIIKLDVLALPPLALVENFIRLKALGVKMLAEKIETHQMLSFCHDLGFDFFQGYLLSRPQLLTRKRLDPATPAATQLVAQIQRDDTSPATLERLLNDTPNLRIALLAQINANLPSETPVCSIQEAAIQFSLSEIKNWAAIIVLSKLRSAPCQHCLR